MTTPLPTSRELIEVINEIADDARRARRQLSPNDYRVVASKTLSYFLYTLTQPPYSLSISYLAERTPLTYQSIRARLKDYNPDA